MITLRGWRHFSVFPFWKLTPCVCAAAAAGGGNISVSMNNTKTEEDFQEEKGVLLGTERPFTHFLVHRSDFTPFLINK